MEEVSKISYSEITHYFESFGFDELKSLLNSEDVQNFVSNLRSNLEYCGKKCDLCRWVIEKMDEEDKAYQIGSSDGIVSSISQKWKLLIVTHRSVFELMGFALLLKMDAMAMLIVLMSPMSDTEKIVLGKHAYTVVAEAKNKDLFTRIALRMKKYPEWALPNEMYKALWEENKGLLKDVTSNKESNKIRNTIDAHKSEFDEQLDVFKTTNWRQSAIDMIRIIQVVSNIEASIYGINKRLEGAYKTFEKDTLEYIGRLNEILKELKG